MDSIRSKCHSENLINSAFTAKVLSKVPPSKRTKMGKKQFIPWNIHGITRSALSRRCWRRASGGKVDGPKHSDLCCPVA